MKYLLFFALLSAFPSKAYLQGRDSIFVVFFVNGFKNDSLHVLMNDKIIMSAMLNNNSDQYPGFTGFLISDSLQCLTLIEVASNKKFNSIVKKGTKYLYVHKLGKDNYEFDYSNKLSLPE
jgi:hypothetical protein